MITGGILNTTLCFFSLSQQVFTHLPPLHSGRHLLLLQVRRGSHHVRQRQQRSAQGHRRGHDLQGDYYGTLFTVAG